VRRDQFIFPLLYELSIPTVSTVSRRHLPPQNQRDDAERVNGKASKDLGYRVLKPGKIQLRREEGASGRRDDLPLTFIRSCIHGLYLEQNTGGRDASKLKCLLSTKILHFEDIRPFGKVVRRRVKNVIQRLGVGYRLPSSGLPVKGLTDMNTFRFTSMKGTLRPKAPHDRDDATGCRNDASTRNSESPTSFG
jgi:hypothetical protein